MRLYALSILLAFITLICVLLTGGSLGTGKQSIEELLTRGGNAAWTVTWGGEAMFDKSTDVALDASGNVYVVGVFSYTVDFDPGPSSVPRTGHNSFFLSKFAPSGQFQWVRTWEGADLNSSPSVAISSTGDVLVAGSFHGGEVDLDPGPADSNHQAIQNHGFLSEFDTNGDFHWVVTWGGEWWVEARDIDIDASGNILIAGCFGGTADLAPGPEVAEFEASGRLDCYLLKLTPSGESAWVRTWGGRGGGEGIECDTAFGVVAARDGAIYVTGGFNQSADFDPGPDGNYLESMGGSDAFLSRYDSHGNAIWTKSWGSVWDDHGIDVDVDDVGNVYVMGSFRGLVDFDPGTVRSPRSGPDARSIFLSRFNSDGEYYWTRVWGTPASEDRAALALDYSGRPFVTGSFNMHGDLENLVPTEQFAEPTLLRFVMCGFTSDGDLVTFCPLERFGPSYGRGVAVDPAGNLYLAGMFDHTVDFDLGFGWENIDERVTTGNMDAFLMKFVLD